MPVDDQLLFIHIPKTGGTSIEAALGLGGDWRVEDAARLYGRIQSPAWAAVAGSNRFLQHLTAAQIHAVAPTLFTGRHSFAVVRDPWTRLLSVYGRPDPDLIAQAAALGVGLRGLSFAAFVEQVEILAPLAHPHLRPQVAFVQDAAGRTLVDQLARFDALAALAADLSARLDRPLAWPHLNRGAAPGVELYDPASLRRVERLYGADIAAFGFAPPWTQKAERLRPSGSPPRE